MSFNLFGCVCGRFHAPGGAMGMAAERVAVPIPFYVIDHPDGVALFDTGLHDSLVDPEDDYRRRLRTTGQDAELTADETLLSHLARLEIDPARVRYAVISHLHFDHAGGLAHLPNATVVVQRREWEAGTDPDQRARYALPRRFFDLGHDLRLIDGEHDLYGDGAVTCIPTPGHTPGHQSLRVRSAAGDHILLADACYNGEALRTRTFPAMSDTAVMGASLDRILATAGPRTVTVFGHDPGQWGAQPVLPATRA